ncbi:MAG: hypothetical protein A3I65_07760 [Betaproteobacteria bacterium RIFCSPLOWO2_02_FULL_68_150]|nr:MAG: hypothetical protein A3I65_07760 [Betaproteobacteria bacterium RIFCSPLOWO2_02_FULL_68_150]
MSDSGKPEQLTLQPVEEIPVLTDVVEAVHPSGLSRAQVDALVAQIERAVLEELTPRLEDAVHQAVRSALESAFVPPPGDDKTP